MENQDLVKLLPLTIGQQELAQKVVNEFQESQLLWLSGFLAGYVSASQKNGTIGKNNSSLEINGISKLNVEPTVNNSSASNSKITTQIKVLFGTRTGNCRKAADLLYQKALDKGIKVILNDMSEYNVKDLKNETNLAIIVSTHGEGEPPLAAEEFYNFLQGPRAPKFEHLQFSVLALGDRSYAQFCKTGADIDQRFLELGGKQIEPRKDCDVDFIPDASNWADAVVKYFSNTSQEVAKTSLNGYAKQTSVLSYDKSNPFSAEIIEKIQLNGKGADKQTYHLELSLEGSGLSYQPGDALGVFPENSDNLVNDLLSIIKLRGDESVVVGSSPLPLKTALKQYFEIGTLSQDVIKKHNQQLNNAELNIILNDSGKLAEFTYGADLVDLLQAYPYPYDAQGLVSILRNLQPRLYSISSAYAAYPDEVHITTGVLRYSSNGRNKKGTCSSYVAEQIKIGNKLRVYIEKNEAFRLPEDASAPIIMLGPGTGVAPFRAFTQHRVESGAKGKNWLIFGDRHFTTDFLYQTEWLHYKKKGVLTNLSVAFSRDHKQKTYVQHKLKEQSKEVVKWIDEGAYIYVCGDMKHMAKDVHNSLIEIISLEKQLDMEEARQVVQNLRKHKRYQEDVY